MPRPGLPCPHGRARPLGVDAQPSARAPGLGVLVGRRWRGPRLVGSDHGPSSTSAVCWPLDASVSPWWAWLGAVAGELPELAPVAGLRDLTSGVARPIAPPARPLAIAGTAG